MISPQRRKGRKEKRKEFFFLILCVLCVFAVKNNDLPTHNDI